MLFEGGAGAFTLALADLLGPDGEIYSVDKGGRFILIEPPEFRRLSQIYPILTGKFTNAP